MTAEVAAGWPVYRLWLRDKLLISEFDKVSIDDVDIACDALVSWDDAERKLAKRKAPKSGG